MAYDIFYVSKNLVNDSDWKEFKQRFPTAVKVENIKNLEQLRFKSFTKFFWIVWDDLSVSLNFYFDYVVPEWDSDYIHAFKNEFFYDGIILYPKHINSSNKEFFNRHFIEKKEIDINASTPKREYFMSKIKTYEDYLNAVEKTSTDMFWYVPDDVIPCDDFKFDIYFSYDNEYDRNMNHVFLNGEYYDGITLFSKHKIISRREFDNRFLIERKEWDIVASYPKPYDKFYISTYDQYLEALEKSSSKIFWVIPDDVELLEDFDINNFFVQETHVNHVFQHKVNNVLDFRGILLLSKSSPISEREFENRFPIERKEWELLASYSKPYEQYRISTYDEYKQVLHNSKSELFWIIPDDVIPCDDFKFDLCFTLDNNYDKNMNHVFLNGEHYDGIMLLSKNKAIGKKEFENRFLVERKEWDILASKSKPYDRFYISTYDEYLEAIEKSNSSLFWVIPNDVELSTEFSIDEFFTDNKNINHVFLNGEYFDGVMLMSKQKSISRKEFENRFPIERKEWEIVVSNPKPYDVFEIGNYDDYIEAKEKTTTELFWIVPKEVEILDFDFSMCASTDGRFERNITHLFQHKFRDEITYNGVMLTSKNINLSNKEIQLRYAIENKEHEILASKLKPYDIIFISYDENNADENYNKLLERFPRAKRVHGVKGIHNAHIEAAKKAETEMFWVVDADALILPEFNFDHEVSRYETDIVHVWQSKNPVNELVYGYGGVKLFPRKMTIDMDTDSLDMTTSISTKFKAMESISNITAFDTDEFNTWKSAFRECVKLASQIIDRRESQEDIERLKIWQTQSSNHQFSKYAISGAKAGSKFGEKYKDNINKLKKINDFNWLKSEFKKSNE